MSDWTRRTGLPEQRTTSQSEAVLHLKLRLV
jgi:hypothetical protein